MARIAIVVMNEHRIARIAKKCAQKKRETEEHARRQAILKKKQAQERKKYLAALAGKEDETWRQVNTLITGKRPADYDEAVQLLRDLKELVKGKSDKVLFQERLNNLCQEHRRKYSLIKRLKDSGLMV